MELNIHIYILLFPINKVLLFKNDFLLNMRMCEVINLIWDLQYSRQDHDLYITETIISVISWRLVLLVEKTRVPGENHRPVASHWQRYHIMLYTSPWLIFEFTTSVVTATDCIGSCKSNHHTTTATTVALYNMKDVESSVKHHQTNKQTNKQKHHITETKNDVHFISSLILIYTCQLTVLCWFWMLVYLKIAPRHNHKKRWDKQNIFLLINYFYLLDL
jgi:hypothetical protein